MSESDQPEVTYSHEDLRHFRLAVDFARIDSYCATTDPVELRRQFLMLIQHNQQIQELRDEHQRKLTEVYNDQINAKDEVIRQQQEEAERIKKELDEKAEIIRRQEDRLAELERDLNTAQNGADRPTKSF